MEFQNHEPTVSDKTTLHDDRPIGVFDSGIGGITVLRELIKKFPQENFIYLGDTARLPYGSKSAPTVRKYTEQNMNYLISKNVKAIVVACNTASTQISETVFENRPVYNVIDPGSALAAQTTKTNQVAVLATRGTVKANSYETKIKKINNQIMVHSVACPLFVSLAEEGWYEDTVTEQVATRYTESLQNKNIDTVVLACTHYPLLKKSILKSFKNPIQFIDSGEAIGLLLEQDFKDNKILKNLKMDDSNQIHICLTDDGPQFEKLTIDLLKEYTQKSIQFDLVTVL